MKKEIKTNEKLVDNLYKAVIKYVEARGGSVVMISGIALVDERTSKYNYGIMVRITGKRPRFNL